MVTSLRYLARSIGAASLFTATLLLSTQIHAQGLTSGSITLVPNADEVNANLHKTLTPSATETVTMGIPFAACTLTDSDNFKLINNSAAEVSIFVKEILTWPVKAPCATGSIRALKVQFVFDATAGQVTYTWDLTGRTTANDIAESPVAEITTDLSTKGGMKEPRVFAIHDPAYLVQSGIVPPTASITTENYDTNYYPLKWEEDSRDLDYEDASASELSQAVWWLFDRASTVYRQAIRRGEVEHYRESYLSHEFYISKINTDGDTGSGVINTCTGGWDFGNLADHGSCDPKFVYVEPLKYHLGLTGDDSFNPTPDALGNITDFDTMVAEMANLLFAGDNRDTFSAAGGIVPHKGFSEPYAALSDKYTERKKGFGLQSVLAACEMLNDATICGWADTIIDNFYAHQTANPDGLGNLGYFGHSWVLHEGGPQPYVGYLANTYTVGTTVIVVDDAVGAVAKFTAGDRANITGEPTPIALASNAVDNGDGTWTLTLATPLTGTRNAGTYVAGATAGFGSLFDLDSDRLFSPWMQSIMMDGIWQYYHWTEDAGRKAKAKEMMLGMAQGFAAYAHDGIRIRPSTKTSVEAAFGVTINSLENLATTSADCGAGVANVPYPRYMANALMAQPGAPGDYYDALTSNFKADQHVPEALFQLAIGIFFETDQAKKAAMQALSTDYLEWFDDYNCTAGNRTRATGIGDPVRANNWQGKPDPFGTYEYIKSFAISYDSSTFIESLANDGTISNSLTLTLGGTKFSRSSGNFVETTEYTISGLPAGFTGATITATSDTTATLTLNGAATSHLVSDDVSNISLTFTDAAFDGFEAARIGNFAKSDLATQFRNPELIYVSDTFNEAAANDGSITNSIVVNLTDDTFVVASGNLTETTHFTVSNEPTGLTVQIAVNAAANQATISFTGNASAHANAQDISNFGIAFTDAAFTTSVAAGVTGSNKTDLSILFVEPALAYGGTVFSEDAGSNDGSIGNSLTITLSDDTFVVPGGAMSLGVHYVVGSVPAGLTAVVTGTSATTATLSLTGNATNHANSDEISNLSLNFLPTAFTTTTSVANVTNASRADLSVNYVEPALLYGGMIFNENAGSNNGSILNNLTLNLSDDTFVVSGGVMTEGVHYNVANVPAGLTAVVTGTSTTTATLALTGAATSHANADEISNLTLTFLPAAFTTSNSVTNLTNASKSNLQILNVEPAIAYSMGTFSEDPASNDGSITDTLVLTLTDDLFVNAGGTLTETTHYTVANLPAGLTLVVNVNGGGTAITLSLTGMAAAHADASDVTDFSFTLLPAAFVTTTDTANVTNAAKSDIGVDFLEQGISYDFNTFVEANANDGSSTTVLNLSLVAETFVVTGAAMTETTHYTVANVPAGMTAVVTGTSANTATLALTGNATNSSAADDVTNLTLSFLDAAFTGGDASVITNATKSDLVVDFLDANLSYSGTVFTEAGADDGSISNTLTLTLTVDTFTVPAAAMTETTHYTVANVPAGLTAVITGTSASSATVALTGNADSHANSDDIANLTLNFLNAAFTNGDASQVNGASNSAISVNFADPAASGGGGSSGGGSTSGTITGLSVEEGATVTNNGTLVDLNNSGTVSGGTVSGKVTNASTASLVDVRLAEGTTVTGGTVRGRITGSGTLVGAVVDAEFVAGAVKIGSGSKVTASTASSVSGLVLTDALKGEDGKLKLSQPLLVDADNTELSALQIAEEEINQLFGSPSGTGDSSDDGLVIISNSELDGLVVPVAPQSVETTDAPSGVTLNDKGELVVIGRGIKTTFAPSAADFAGFQAGIEAAGASIDLLSNGSIFVELSGNTISLRFSLVAIADSGAAALSTVRALSSSDTSFSVTGSVAAPASYRIVAHYSDGTSQEVLPAVHDVSAFDVWMDSAGYSSVTDGITGFISVLDEDGTMIWRGVPDYSLLPPDASASSSVDFSSATDLNGDGIGDIYFNTDQWKQVIYGLPPL